MIANFNDHAANERTFLAWVRTAMAVVGFGLAASRLKDKAPDATVDLALLVAGGLVIILAYLRMRLLKRRIDASQTLDDDAAVGETLMILIIGSFFALMVLFFIQVK